MGHTYIHDTDHLKDLKEAVNHLHKHSPWRQGHDPHSAPHVLIVDDDVESIQPLLVVLQNFGFEVTVAFDGQEGLYKISKEKFDLVFLDINMPGLNGVEVLGKIQDIQLENLRSCKRWPRVPVITYSSRDISELNIPDEQGFIHEGHWQKPVTIPDLTTLTGMVVNQLKLHLPKVPVETPANTTDGNEGGSL
jgi:CheY-like chemotaxis protein